MGNCLRWVAIVSLTFVVSVLFFNRASWPGRCGSFMTIPRKRTRWQETVPVKQYRERTDQALAAYSTHDQTRSEMDKDNGELQVGEPVKQNGEWRVSFTARELAPEFHSERQIPGGPDGQHHGSNDK